MPKKNKKEDTSDSDSGPDDSRELADMHLLYGEADGDAALAQKLYGQRFPNRALPKHGKFAKIDQNLRETGSLVREPVKKKVKTDGSCRTDDKEPTWDLGKNKLVKISEFKGKLYVNIREFYDAGGELRPGKKGIMLTMEQWQRFKASIDEIEEEVQKH